VCNLCGETVDVTVLLAHLRCEHPEVPGEIECWPDGEPVIVDESLTPADFTGRGAA
jgi:hypothetical protein